MKNINNYISEHLIKQHIKGQEHTESPKTKWELEAIIRKRIKEFGPKTDLNFIDVENISDFSNLFNGTKFNGNVSKWCMRNAKTTECMFAYCPFDGDLSLWDVKSVENMNSMFEGSRFTGKNGDIGGWNTKSLVSIISMFKDSKFDCNIDNWDTKNVTEVAMAFANIDMEPPEWYYDALYR